MTAEEFAAFHVRTGDIIKSIQPDAKIIALGLAGLSRTEYVKSILDILKSKTNWINLMCFLSMVTIRCRRDPIRQWLN